MTQSSAPINPQPAKAKVFFDRADQVAETGNWDFAIELYLEGITRDPGNIERGHQPMRQVSLNRKAKGGKSAGFMEQLKRRPGKDPLTNLLNAEYLLAKEPGDEANMVAALKAAADLDLRDLTQWVADILMESQKLSARKNRAHLMLLKDAYAALELYDRALLAVQMAQQAAPNDPQLAEFAKDLSVKNVIKKGQFDKEGDFRKGVKNDAAQQELIQKDSLVKSESFLRQQINKARGEYEATPTVPGKITGLVEALLKTEEEGDENEAIDVLAKAHKDTGAYQFKAKIGDIKVRQMTRRYRNLLAGNEKVQAAELAKQILEFELAEYKERAANYPTDLGIKYELGRRYLLSGDYDNAIGSFQQAQRDPRRHVASLNYLGQAFAKKQWFREASETFERALQSEMGEERKKEILYHLAEVSEKLNDLSKAQGLYSDLAQMDFNYRDVRTRLEAVRQKNQAQP